MDLLARVLTQVVVQVVRVLVPSTSESAKIDLLSLRHEFLHGQSDLRTLGVSAPELMFDGPFLNLVEPSYDVSPDGARFLVVEGLEMDKTSTVLGAITNLSDLLEKQVASP